MPYFYLIAVLLYLIWLALGSPPAELRGWLGNLALGAASATAFVLALRAAMRLPKPSGLRQAWIFIAAGLGLHLAGDVLRMGFLAVSPLLIFHFSLVDILYFSGYLSLAVGFVLHPRVARISNSYSGQRQGWLRMRFDLLLTTAAGVTLLWEVILRPAFQLATRIPTPHVAAYFYPLSDLLLLLLLATIFLYSKAESLPRPLGWAALGLALFTLSDLVYSLQLLGASYQPGGWVDAGWVLGDVALAYAAFIQFRAAPQIPVAGTRAAVDRLLTRLQSSLPIVAVLALGAYAIAQWQVIGQSEPLALWMTVLLSILLIARQSLHAGEVEFQQYASLVNSVAEPAFVADSAGRLVLVNPALLQAAGASDPKDLLGQPLTSLVGEQAQRNALKDAFRNGWSGELNLIRRDGGSLPVFLSLRPLGDAGGRRELALAGTAHDLSLQKQQQADLRGALTQVATARQELEVLNTGLEMRVKEKTASLSEAYATLESQNLALQKLDELKSDFVALVSHELRAPLTNISGGIELLLQARQPLPEHPRQTLEMVQAEIVRLNHFVETILDLSALDAGRLPLYPGPLPLTTVRESLCKTLSHQPGADRIHWKLPADLPPVDADEKALGSVLFHLLDNALKYAPQDEITVAASAVEDKVCIQVSDHGPGIDPEALPLIFDRFYRRDSSDARTVYGHGLGLHIVRRLVEAMDGEVQVANRPEGGAVFTVWLEKA